MTICNEGMRSEQYNKVRSELDKYFVSISVPCPYGLGTTAVYRQALLGGFTDRLLQIFLATGHRRNGSCIYRMACPDCNSCIPIRLNPEEFIPNRNQKRAVKKNKDVRATVGPLRITEEKLAVCNKFLFTRYPGRNNTAEQYYGEFFLCGGRDTYEIEYRVGKKLIGVCIVDVSSAWINCVYFFFDPAMGSLSPGTYNLLFLIDFCKRSQIKSLYLGYWIKEVQAMGYKANFKPHYLFQDSIWKKVG